MTWALSDRELDMDLHQRLPLIVASPLNGRVAVGMTSEGVPPVLSQYHHPRYDPRVAALEHLSPWRSYILEGWGGSEIMTLATTYPLQEVTLLQQEVDPFDGLPWHHLQRGREEETGLLSDIYDHFTFK